MNSYLLVAPYSLLLSIILLLGNFCIGHLIFKNKFLNMLFQDISNINFQKILVGQFFLIFLMFPLIVIFHEANKIIFFFIFINFFCLFFFLVDFFLLKNIKNLQINFLKKKSIYYYILCLVIILYFLLASSPITDADSLDYHIGSAINILRYDSYVLFKEWFTLAGSGSGETLVAFGLYAGAEQYASLIQFSGLLSISGILLRTSNESKVFKSPFLLPLIILTCPVLLFLVSTAKPQLFFSASLLVALAIIYSNNYKQNILAYVLVNIIIFVCMTGKFSFSLSGFLIWILATLRIANTKNIVKLFFISAVVCLLIYFPYIYWKWSEYGGNFFLYFLSPYPLHLPGYSNLLEHIRASQGLGLKFPYFLIITNSLLRITETLGFSSLIFLYYFFHKKNCEIYSILTISVVYLILSNLYASPNARYFFDILLWLAFGLKYIKLPEKNFNFLKIFYFSQIFIIILALIHSTYNFFPGSITEKQYFTVKNKYANEYTGVKWVIEEIGNEKVVIFARSISHDGFAISGLFMNFTNSIDSLYYKNLIKEKKVKYYATFGDFPRFEDFEGCITSLYKIKNNVGIYAVRNPFAKNSSYNGYIYHLDYSKLPTCKK